MSSRLPDLYQSEMLIQIMPQRVPESFVQTTVALSAGERLSALGQQTLSRIEIERLIQAFDLYTDVRSESPMQNAVELMREHVEFEIARGDLAGSPLVSRRAGSAAPDAFYVRFMYPDAEVATRVTAQIGALFVEQDARDRGASAEGTSEFLEAQLAEAGDRLEQLDRRLEEFREQNAGRLPEQLDFNMQALDRAQLQLQAQRESIAQDQDRRLMLERMYNQAQAEVLSVDPPFRGQPSGQLTDGDLAGAETPQERLALARSALAALELRLRPEHPDVIRTKRVVEELEAEVAGESDVVSETALTRDQLARRDRESEMRAEIESLGRQIEFKQAEERRLRAVIADYEQRIEGVPSVESEWIALSRDHETQQLLYTDLLSKTEQAELAADLEQRQAGEQFRVLDLPQVPLEPTVPNRFLISAVGMAGSLFLGLALAALIELRDSTFRTEGEIRELLALPVVAHVPYVESAADCRWQRVRRLMAFGTAIVVLAVGGYGFWMLELWRYIV